MNDTFTRLTAFAFRWARGELAHRLTVTIAGLMPDAIADASRQVMRMLLPLDSTMPDMLPSLFTRFGLPPYAPGVIPYLTQIKRLQSVLDTHSRAGGVDQMLAELATIGVVDAAFFTFPNGYKLGAEDVAPLVIDGSWVIGDGVCVDATVISVPITQSIVQMFDYFSPDFMLGFEDN